MTSPSRAGTKPSETGRDAGPNPLAVALERLPVHATTLVIFGATGDLARRKLLPALYNLAHEGALPEHFALVGSSRGALSDEEFRELAASAVGEFSRRPPDEKVLANLFETARYVAGSFDDDTVYERLATVLPEIDEQAGVPMNRCFYLSTAPEFFPVIVKQLGSHDLDDHDHAEVRVIIEKPFGTRLAEARELNEIVLSVFEERQVFRIDHYLGKETVQNVLALRFANGMFEPLWNRNYIDHVQITASEDIGIGTRAGYYDHAGALRDLVQNHMLQLLTLLCMEPPVDFSADEVRDEKVKVLRAIHAADREEVPGMAVRAQYARGNVAGVDVPGYLEEAGVPDDSNTETYAALRLEVDNWRWAGVPMVPAHGQAPRAEGHRDRRDAQARAAPRLPRRGVDRRAAERPRADRPAQRGRVAVDRGEDPRHADGDPPGADGVPLRLGVHVAVAGGLRAADPRRDARRRDALHPQRRGRGAVEHLRPDRRDLGADAGSAAAVRGRLTGAGGGRRPAGRRAVVEDDLMAPPADPPTLTYRRNH